MSGHRRKKACELAGLDTVKAEVREMTRDEAIILMVESNLQRSTILPSEKAFSYKMRLEAMKRQAGRPSQENYSPLGNNSLGTKSSDEMAEEVGESKNTIFRYKAPQQNKSVMLANIEKLKSKKDILLDMRSDGQITKEEFLKKKEDIDKKISQLTAEYEKDDCPTESDEAGLELGKIEAALNELIDFSQLVLPREIYQKFVSKVTPYSKTHYRWYLNLDGTGTQMADVKVNGRKSNATVAFCDEGEIPPVHFKEIIFFNILKQEIKNKKSFFVATLHRLLLEINQFSEI